MGAAFLWGTIGIWVKVVYSETTMGPISLAWFRFLFTIPVLGLATVSQGYRFSLTLREIGLFAVFGSCGITMFEVLYFVSFAYTNVQHVAALIYTAPAFVAILSRLILNERLTRGKIVAVLVSMLGTFLLMGVARGEPLFGSRSQIGDWLAVGAGVSYSFWYIFGKLLGKNRAPAMTSFLAMSFGTIFLLPIMIAFEGVRPPESIIAWSLVAFIGIVPSAIAYLLYFAGLNLIDATEASVIAITEPVTAAILAFLLFQESLSPDSFLGFALIIGSILLISSTRT